MQKKKGNEKIIIKTTNKDKLNRDAAVKGTGPKIIFIPARSRIKIRIPVSELKNNDLIGKNIGIATTVQHEIEVAEALKSKEIIFYEESDQRPASPSKVPPKLIYAGKVLGCKSGFCESIAEKVDCFLFVGTGRFHAINIALCTKKPTYLFDPWTKKIGLIKEEEIDAIRKKERGGILKFLSSKKIGIIISTKKGQNNYGLAKEFVSEYNKKQAKDSEEEHQGEKQFYIFVCDTLNFSELENFPFIDCWLNTACPRIGIDDAGKAVKTIVNLQAVKQFLESSSAE